MKYYKSADGTVYSFYEGSQDYLITDDMVEMTPSEIDEHVSTEPIRKTKFSSNAYLERFTPVEQEAIAGLAMTDVSAKLWYDKMLSADFIDIEDPRTVAGLDFAVSAGIIDEARKSEILTPDTAQ